MKIGVIPEIAGADLKHSELEEDWNEIFLIPREKAESMQMGVVRMKPGGMTKMHKHGEGFDTRVDPPVELKSDWDEEGEEAFVGLKGKGSITVGEETYRMEPGMVFHVPRHTDHEIRCEDPDGMTYLFFSVVGPDKTKR
jgi:quercetin dioxygenase-like cupin family protein